MDKVRFMLRLFLIIVMTTFILSSCSNNLFEKQESEKVQDGNRRLSEKGVDELQLRNEENIKTIYLAGGCFWGVEGYFQRIKGVVETETGYANGRSTDTNYEKIKETDHAETVEIKYDMSIISLEEILLHYFRIIDPTSVNKQGNDIGRQYRTGVYYIEDSQLEIINKIFNYEEEINGKLAVEIASLKNFVSAEDYHQDYLKNNPNGYCHINLGIAYEPLFSGTYENPDDEEIKKIIDEESYHILRENATERPNSSALNQEYRRGIYVDKITGEPLFSSSDKFESGCGWPSFAKPILTDRIDYREDTSHGMKRIEVRSLSGDNHLGHVFTDGIKEKGGLRYCINGASLKFIPLEDMEKEGYSPYKIFCD